MTNKKLVIFDMDGTLVDSSMAIANAINYVRKELYLPELLHSDIIKNVNNHDINPARYFYNAPHFLPEHERLFSSYYSANHANELFLYDGIENLLKMLNSMDVKLAVATNAYRQSALQSLEYLGIVDYFDDVACFDDVEEGKPSPLMLLKIINSVEKKNKDAIFVGDGERDKMAASRADIDYIMVNWGFSNYTNNVINDIDILGKLLIGACKRQ